MARTRNSFTGSAGDSTLVDKMLGNSYDVVKAVYLKLPVLEDLQTNQNIDKLADNYDDVKEILNSTESIVNVNNNLDQILAASTHATDAKNSASSASTSAEVANKASTEATKTLNEAVSVRDSLEDYKDELEVVSTNIDSVKTVSKNIVSVNDLADIFNNNLTTAKIEEITTNLDEIISVADNMYEVTQVANRFIGNGDLDRIEAAVEDIHESLDEYHDVLDQIRDQVALIDTKKTEIDGTVQVGIQRINEEATARLADIHKVKEECDALLQQIAEANQVVSDNVDTSNNILLQMRDIYHSFEEAITALHKRMLLEIQHEGDHQCARIRKEGEIQVERLYSQMTEIINAVLDDMREQADAILQEKLEELQNKADEIIAQIEAKLEEINIDLSEFEQRLNAVEEQNKELVKQIEQILKEIEDLKNNDGSSADIGDIRWGYYDYSLQENQDNMEVGVTYIVFHDENDNYIQLNPDNNSIPKEAYYMRLYTKSQSGFVSYRQKEVKLDLSGYLKREELKQATIYEQGISELATVAEVEAGIDGTRTITPLTLDRALPSILIKKLEQNPNGLTNTIVQQIIKTIASDTHLQEDLADSIRDDILGESEGGIGQPGEDISFSSDITFKGDNVFEGNNEFQGDVNFSGNVTVPNQVPPDDPSQWPGNTVINKDDVIKLIENSKKTSIEVLPNYPTSADNLEEDILYSCPLEDSGNEITIITLRENEQASTATVQEGEQAFFAAGDLL